MILCSTVDCLPWELAICPSDAHCLWNTLLPTAAAATEAAVGTARCPAGPRWAVMEPSALLCPVSSPLTVPHVCQAFVSLGKLSIQGKINVSILYLECKRVLCLDLWGFWNDFSMYLRDGFSFVLSHMAVSCQNATCLHYLFNHQCKLPSWSLIEFLNALRSISRI